MNHTHIRIILVSGMSGAGKTTTMGILEDMGYRCVDQLPYTLLPAMMDLVRDSKDPRFLNLALSTYLSDFEAFHTYLAGLNFDLSVVLLDAGNAEILKRYKSSRRMHPMLLSNAATTLEEGIVAEREIFNTIKDQSVTNLDTSFLTAIELKQKLNKVLSIDNRPTFSISFISFGYKNGVPLDADLLFDVRFLPNPYWDETLRSYNGNDEIVYDFVMLKEETKVFIQKLEDFLDYAFKEYMNEGKNHFTVGIGCTGGQHRSVSVVNYLYERYGQLYQVYKDHRDLE